MLLVRKFLADRKAATAIEYGLIAALISVALIGGFGALTNSLGNVFSTVSTTIENAG